MTVKEHYDHHPGYFCSWRSNDFPVTVISDGHTTSDRPDLTARHVAAQYKWIWRELSPAKYKSKVIDCNACLQDNQCRLAPAATGYQPPPARIAATGGHGRSWFWFVRYWQKKK
jgi:hypothetical protein